MQDLPTNVYKETEDSTIQEVEDVSSLVHASDGPQGYWKREGKWDYLVESQHPWNFWPDLKNTHTPARIIALKKKPVWQEKSWKPVLFAAVQFEDAIGYRLGYDMNWLRLVQRKAYNGKQLFRMMSGDRPVAIILSNSTANELFGPM